MDLAVGIDVGFSPSRRSTGVVLVERRTKGVAPGSRIVVDTATKALDYVGSELRRLKPASVKFCVDGPFAPAAHGENARQVERLFMSGPFSTGRSPRMRLKPAGTGPMSPFLQATARLVGALKAAGFVPATLMDGKLIGDIVEIFPTIFLGALLVPHDYRGNRNSHTNDLWLKAIGLVAVNGLPATRSPLLAPYTSLIAAAEGVLREDRHDARMAATSAIAADLVASAPPGCGLPSAAGFIGHPEEHGFAMPPRADFDSGFADLLVRHWQSKARGSLVWL